MKRHTPKADRKDQYDVTSAITNALLRLTYGQL